MFGIKKFYKSPLTKYDFGVAMGGFLLKLQHFKKVLARKNVARKFWPANIGPQILARKHWPANFGPQILARKYWPANFGPQKIGPQILARKFWPAKMWPADIGPQKCCPQPAARKIAPPDFTKFSDVYL